MVQLAPPPIVGHDKYRDFTVVPCIFGCGLLFVMIILFGGPTVRKEVKALEPKYRKWVIVECNKTAYMHNREWEVIMNELECRTRKQRKTDFMGMNPKEHITLHDDNCGSHCSEEQTQKYISRNKIHTRKLIPNATHLQQMVDQNVAVCLKNDIKNQYWDWGEELLDDVEAGLGDYDDKVSAKEKRAKIVEFTYYAAERLSRKLNLIRKSWINFGIDLPMDGSKDSDPSTIHRNGRYRSRYEDIEIRGSNEDTESTENDKEESE